MSWAMGQTAGAKHSDDACHYVCVCVCVCVCMCDMILSVFITYCFDQVSLTLCVYVSVCVCVCVCVCVFANFIVEIRAKKYPLTPLLKATSYRPLICVCTLMSWVESGWTNLIKFCHNSIDGMIMNLHTNDLQTTSIPLHILPSIIALHANYMYFCHALYY